MEEKNNINKLMKFIRNSKNVFLMAHKNLDLDALGSTIGLYEIIKKKRKNVYIIIDEKKHEAGVAKVLIELTGCIEIIKTEEIEEKMHPKNSKNLLVILDTNKTELVQSVEALKKFDRKVILDHHNTGKGTIKDAYHIIEPEVSSTCEMITTLIEKYDLELDPYYSTVLLAGIVLDTNNFILKTTRETYYSAYYLSCLGASAQKVQYLLKQDLEEYTEREKLLTSVETIGNIAITKGSPYTIYRREDIAKVAAKEEKELSKAAKMKTITKARDKVACAFNDYNAALGYTKPMPKDFWNVMFDIYEEGLDYNKNSTKDEEKEWSILDLLDFLIDASDDESK